MANLSSTIEAILYLKAQPLTLGKLAEYAGCDRNQVRDALLELMANYAQRESALEVVETSEGYCLQLRSEFQPLVQTLIPLDLGVGALRTLAAIALKGPISQTELVDLRGSGVYQHVPELVSLGFVRKRRQSDGRSFWLQVTEKFAQYFQVDTLPQGFDVLKESLLVKANENAAVQSEHEVDSGGRPPDHETTSLKTASEAAPAHNDADPQDHNIQMELNVQTSHTIMDSSQRPTQVEYGAGVVDSRSEPELSDQNSLDEDSPNEDSPNEHSPDQHSQLSADTDDAPLNDDAT